MKKEMGRVTIHFIPDEEKYIPNERGTINQIVWSAPAMRDDNGKIRCPDGFIKIRLWKKSPDEWVLSQSIKAIMGGGDVPLRFGIRVDEKEIIGMGASDLEEYIFTLKGDYDVLLPNGII